MFLDADDLFELDSCQHMYSVIEENEADYVIGNYQMMDEDGKKWKNPAFDTEKYAEFRLDKHDYQKSFFVMNSTAWNKIYRRQFLEENAISFEVPSPSEDDYFTSLCYMKAKVGFYTSKVMYLYRNTPNSLSKDCSLSYFKGINYAYQRIFESYQKNQELNYYRYVYAKKNAYLLCQLIDSEQVSLTEKIECVKQLEWYFELREKLKISTIHTSLAQIMQWIQQKDYEKVAEEMERLKEYRKGLPEQVKKRMSFPTRENYAQMEEHKEKFEGQGEEVCFR